MSLFIRSPESCDNRLPAKEVLQQIYIALKGCNGCPSEVFVKHHHRIRHTEVVLEEARRIEREVIVSMGSKNAPKGKVALESAITSDHLNVSTVVADVIIYNPSYKEGRTFKQFADAYQVAKEEIAR